MKQRQELPAAGVHGGGGGAGAGPRHGGPQGQQRPVLGGSRVGALVGAFSVITALASTLQTDAWPEPSHRYCRC